MAIVIFVTIAIIFTPVFYQIVYKQRIFIMPFFFPYLDYNTDFGYYLTSMFHAICVFFGAFGNFVSDSWCFVFAAHIPLIKSILQSKFNELNELLRENCQDAHKIKVILKDIFQWHQKNLV